MNYTVPLNVDQITSVGGYTVLYADPAWTYNDAGSNGAAADQYDLMTLEQICAMPVDKIAAKNAILFLWATYPLIQEALQVIDAWGFEYKSIAFQWIKHYPKAQKPVLGLGRWTRGNTEPCFLATRGKAFQHVRAKNVSQLIFTEEGSEIIETPQMRHSEKPALVRDRIDQLVPNVPRVELFARKRKPGWDLWGNEAEGGADILL